MIPFNFIVGFLVFAFCFLFSLLFYPGVLYNFFCYFLRPFFGCSLLFIFLVYIFGFWAWPFPFGFRCGLLFFCSLFFAFCERPFVAFATFVCGFVWAFCFFSFFGLLLQPLFAASFVLPLFTAFLWPFFGLLSSSFSFFRPSFVAFGCGFFWGLCFRFFFGVFCRCLLLFFRPFFGFFQLLSAASFRAFAFVFWVFFAVVYCFFSAFFRPFVFSGFFGDCLLLFSPPFVFVFSAFSVVVFSAFPFSAFSSTFSAFVFFLFFFPAFSGLSFVSPFRLFLFVGHGCTADP